MTESDSTGRDLATIDRQRYGLLQVLLLVIMSFLAAVTWLAFSRGLGNAIPILAGLSLAGCLFVVTRERRLSHEREALGNALLAEQGRSSQLDARVQELTSLYRAISAVNSVRDADSDTMTEAVLQSALDLVGGDCGSVMLLEDDGRSFVIAQAVGLEHRVAIGAALPADSGVAATVVAEAEPLLLTGSALADERFRSPIARPDLEHSMSIPLVRRDRVFGVLNLGSTAVETADTFTEYHLRMAMIFAQHAAFAIDVATSRAASEELTLV